MPAKQMSIDGDLRAGVIVMATMPVQPRQHVQQKAASLRDGRCDEIR